MRGGSAMGRWVIEREKEDGGFSSMIAENEDKIEKKKERDPPP